MHNPSFYASRFQQYIRETVFLRASGKRTPPSFYPLSLEILADITQTKNTNKFRSLVHSYMGKLQVCCG